MNPPKNVKIPTGSASGRPSTTMIRALVTAPKSEMIAVPLT